MNTVFKEADNLLRNFKNWEIKSQRFDPLAEDIDTVLSEHRLEEIKLKGDLEKARYLEGNDNRFTFFRNNIIKDLNLVLEQEFNTQVNDTGLYWYPRGGYCGWHTNSDAQNNNRTGKRIYLVWAQDESKSFFRYKDRESGAIITNWDKKGWQVKEFNLTKEDPLWHCVGSKTNRISIGFNFY
jgi:hypothetical protein